jgi:hypothetical protein
LSGSSITNLKYSVPQPKHFNFIMSIIRYLSKVWFSFVLIYNKNRCWDKPSVPKRSFVSWQAGKGPFLWLVILHDSGLDLYKNKKPTRKSFGRFHQLLLTVQVTKLRTVVHRILEILLFKLSSITDVNLLCSWGQDQLSATKFTNHPNFSCLSVRHKRLGLICRNKFLI